MKKAYNNLFISQSSKVYYIPGKIKLAINTNNKITNFNLKITRINATNHFFYEKYIISKNENMNIIPNTNNDSVKKDKPMKAHKVDSNDLINKSAGQNTKRDNTIKNTSNKILIF